MQQPDMQQILALAQSEAGRKLMEVLQQENRESAEKAASFAAKGDMEQAKQSLSGMLQKPDIQKLLKELEKQL